MEWYLILALIGAGFLAGFINTLAGGGSLITLPLLMFMGLPANMANATNRIAIIVQNIVGVASFKKQKVFSYKEGIWLAIPATAGAIPGALLATHLTDVIMTRIIGGLLIFMFFMIILKPDIWIKGRAGLVKAKPNLLQIIIFFCIGFYGGFIQAGVGFFLIAGLVLGTGFDLVKANAIKLFIVLLYTSVAILIFVIYKHVDFKWGLLLAIGNASGAYLASRFAVSWGPKFVKIVLLIIIFLAAMKLLGVIDLIFGTTN
ncbi:sulfite exporter TauE/SafE family protein [Bacteroidota bacterium]